MTATYKGQLYDTDRPPICAAYDFECVAIGRALSNIRQIELENARREIYMANCIANAAIGGRPVSHCAMHALLPVPTIAQCLADRSGRAITGAGEALLDAIARLKREAGVGEATYTTVPAPAPELTYAPATSAPALTYTAPGAAPPALSVPGAPPAGGAAPPALSVPGTPPAAGAAPGFIPEPPANIPAWAWAAAAAALLMVVK